MNAMSTSSPEAGKCPTARKSWRTDAARIVEELFRCTPTDSWNMLLDLREHLLGGDDWNETLDLFLSCRERLEAEQYLPFYRLRRLLAESLRLEAGAITRTWLHSERSFAASIVPLPISSGRSPGRYSSTICVTERSIRFSCVWLRVERNVACSYEKSTGRGS